MHKQHHLRGFQDTIYKNIIICQKYINITHTLA